MCVCVCICVCVHVCMCVCRIVYVCLSVCACVFNFFACVYVFFVTLQYCVLCVHDVCNCAHIFSQIFVLCSNMNDVAIYEDYITMNVLLEHYNACI